MKVDKGALIKWLITIAVPLILFLIPETDVYTYEVKMFLVVTVGGILLVAFEQVHLMAVSMLSRLVIWLPDWYQWMWHTLHGCKPCHWLLSAVI